MPRAAMGNGGCFKCICLDHAYNPLVETLHNGYPLAVSTKESEGITMQDIPVMKLLASAKMLAQQYRAMTGKPLGITGEVAEYEASRILGVELTPARQAGYDAIETVDGATRRLQIKGRCLLNNCKPGQRLGSIDIKKHFDAVLLVLLDEDFNATSIHEADRDVVIAALAAPGSRSRNERGALGVGKFKSIARLRWSRTMKSEERLDLTPKMRALSPPITGAQVSAETYRVFALRCGTARPPGRGFQRHVDS